ncbi:MAG: prepilin-type N-terminal cleavage/methylation domain-containing protein [Verrucomicrobiota bacterium]|nr:prepilin-type N-terminal cleavage/methylation domain-containing protein [Verrucomicrobiota bacterium]
MSRSAFTLVEMLLTLALIALLGTIVVMNAESLFKGLGEKPVPDVLRDAVREARFQAAYTKEAAFLSYDGKEGLFLISGMQGQKLEQLATGLNGEDTDLKVKFFQILPYRGAEVTGRYKREEVKYVPFHPDRSAMPFEAEIRLDGNTSDHRFDPFSDVEIVESK